MKCVLSLLLIVIGSSNLTFAATFADKNDFMTQIYKVFDLSQLRRPTTEEVKKLEALVNDGMKQFGATDPQIKLIATDLQALKIIAEIGDQKTKKGMSIKDMVESIQKLVPILISDYSPEIIKIDEDLIISILDYLFDSVKKTSLGIKELTYIISPLEASVKTAGLETKSKTIYDELTRALKDLNNLVQQLQLNESKITPQQAQKTTLSTPAAQQGTLTQIMPREEKGVYGSRASSAVKSKVDKGVTSLADLADLGVRLNDLQQKLITLKAQMPQ